MRFLAVLAALSVVVTLGGGALLASFNQFARVSDHFEGQCKPVRGVPGPEDIVVHPETRRAFISSLDRHTPGARGAIMVFNVDDPLLADWRDRAVDAPEPFRPLGIDLFDNGEIKRLFVVNEAGPSVEVFDIDADGDLVHLRTHKERRLTSPNAVAALGPDSFYVTNDLHAGRETLAGGLQFLARAPAGSVLSYRDGVWRRAAEGLRFANGIALDPDGDVLYVAETASRDIVQFDINRATGALMMRSRTRLPSAPDNLHFDDSGALWVGGLPKPLLAPYQKGAPTRLAPSEVFMITRETDSDELNVKSIFRDDGDLISTSTTAARLGRRLLIGTLYQDRFLWCGLPQT